MIVAALVLETIEGDRRRRPHGSGRIWILTDTGHHVSEDGRRAGTPGQGRFAAGAAVAVPDVLAALVDTSPRHPEAGTAWPGRGCPADPGALAHDAWRPRSMTDRPA
jgi:hypothetical protein